ncbi:MAG TPA: hypothetical protein VKD72_18175, partial [Gemmataceae bacterium]|nr:hypothetical protein [Gemmataceae bacterium]
MLGLAAVGLILSLVAHVCGLLGLPQPLGHATWLLHIGPFITLIPAMFAADRLVKKPSGKDLWAGCPKWIRDMAAVLTIYCIINFAIFMVWFWIAWKADALPKDSEDGAPDLPIVFRGFSGHWMAF